VATKLVAFVPIKLNSQRLAGKNLKILGSVPLMCFILEALLKVDHIDDVYVFCSDESIIELLPNQVKFLKRDESLDADETIGSDIYDSFVSKVEADYYLLAHATSPFILPETITYAVNKVLNDDFDSAFTTQAINNFVWYENKPLNYSLDCVPRTQDIEPVYVECSAFFIFSRRHWMEKKRRIGELPYMILLHGREAIDIDDQEDFLLAEFYLERGPNV
jgi:CMP-N-acetylneuraminic acid synthetase